MVTYTMSSPVDEVKKTNLECTNALGQLIRVNDPHENATWVYNYDRGGNILSKVRYAYTTGTLGTALETTPYAYGDANWKDKLTAYNGKAITYDAIGNPLTDGTWTYQWQAGRQLKRMSTEGKAVSFKYDHNGMRIQKVLEHSWYPETTNYTYHGKLLTHMTVDYTDWDEVAQQDNLHFFYDAQSRPVKIGYNGVIYTYVHNLQGDIVGILDSTGALVVEYKYDAWGKLLATTGSLADTLGIRNPFRYRSYVYDEESGLYYLKSRYYSTEYCRFLIIDSYIAGAVGDVLNHNGYLYCGNKPSSREDDNGEWFLACVIGAAVSLAFEYAGDVVKNFKEGKRGLEAFVPDSPARDYIAAAVGGFIAAIPGGSYLTTAAVGAISNVVDKTIRGDIKDSSDVIEAALIGGYSNVAGRYVSESIAGHTLNKMTSSNRSTRKSYAQEIYGGKNRSVNDNLRKLMSETTQSYANRFTRYAVYSAIGSTFSVNVILAEK